MSNASKIYKFGCEFYKLNPIELKQKRNNEEMKVIVWLMKSKCRFSDVDIKHATGKDPKTIKDYCEKIVSSKSAKKKSYKILRAELNEYIIGRLHEESKAELKKLKP